ncbi:uncharacterized protein HaLaN_28582 [Haematococcus lacustris]|uniref:Uncharacterized protein n=1 Tax=Haematococcus lacustris TaxID=44745 RepID=A0A6A0ADD3_HAELA|nr:uncharacterized protein HaLaN_28582 [Haematococcus lacustris]
MFVCVCDAVLRANEGIEHSFQQMSFSAPLLSGSLVQPWPFPPATLQPDALAPVLPTLLRTPALTQLCTPAMLVFSRSAPAVKAAGRALTSARTTVAAASQALPLSGLSAAAASAAHAASPGLNSGAATSLHSSWLLLTWLSQEVGLLLDFFRNTLFRCVKALQAVVNCFIAMGLILNRHRVSLMMQSKRTGQNHMCQPGIQCLRT